MKLMRDKLSVLITSVSLVIFLACTVHGGPPVIRSRAETASQQEDSLEVKDGWLIDPQYADCGDCKGGKCVRDEKTKKSVCQCKPGQGWYFKTGIFGTSECRDCKCGGNGNEMFSCIFKPSTFSDNKRCKCPAGHSDYDGTCEECKCGGNGIEKFNCTIEKPFLGSKTTKCKCPTGYEIDGKICKVKEIDPCKSGPCKNGGTCTKGKTPGNYTCKCPPNFNGNKCEQEIDPCKSGPCQNGGTCTKGKKPLSYTCKCPSNFNGTNCELEIDPCKSGPCQNGGTCAKGKKPGNYTCKCRRYYNGTNCEIEINPCDSSPCQNGGTCTKGMGLNYTCSCRETHTGNNCETEIDPCSSYPCLNGATCLKREGLDYECRCPDGFAGKNCSEEVDPCPSNPCKNYGTCTQLNGTHYKCICPETHTGKNCETEINPCDAQPCQNGGTCVRLEGLVFNCTCPPTHEGKTCEQEINPCDSKPCQNGGTCIKEAGLNYSCQCPPTHNGSNCEIEINPCDEEPCKNGGNCTKGIGLKYTCSCPPTHTGKDCETVINPCSPSPCENGGTCVQGKDLNYTCTCPATHTGQNCETAIDPCSSSPCKNGGTCVKREDLNYTCTCPATHTGQNCETVLGPCSKNPCSNGGTCVETDNQKYTCKCPPSFTGSKCETVISPCSKNPCLNGATCIDGKQQSYTCKCPAKFSGKNCETAIVDACNPNPCKNNGTCTIVKNDFRCKCSKWFVGKQCENSKWCSEDGKKICGKASCGFDAARVIGYCICGENMYFDYSTLSCNDFDRCLFTPNKCTKPNQECKNNKCICKENFVDKDGSCVPNFCAKKNECGVNENCLDDAKNPGHVSCVCKDGFGFNGHNCTEVDVCNHPAYAKCQQICNKDGTCACEDGFELSPDKVSCKAKSGTTKCALKCGKGTCVQKGEKSTCSCPSTHVLLNETCIDKCTAEQLPKNLCPDNKCKADSTFGFVCICDGSNKMSTNNVTCERIAMCTEGGKDKECTKKNAVCEDDNNTTSPGYQCKCRNGYETDSDGQCKSMCELKNYKDMCSAKFAICQMKPDNTVGCKCPPTFTFGAEGNCSKLATVSYVGSLPLAKDYYLSSSSENWFSDLDYFYDSSAVLNLQKIRKDLKESVKHVYSDITFTDIIQCNATDKTVSCSFEMQFKTNPERQVNLLTSPSVCISDKADPTKCVVPPRLVLQKDIQAAPFVKANPCMELVVEETCGENTTCSLADGNNFVCSCSAGYSSYAEIKPLSDKRTIIHKCQVSPQKTDKNNAKDVVIAIGTVLGAVMIVAVIAAVIKFKRSKKQEDFSYFEDRVDATEMLSSSTEEILHAQE